MTNEQARDLCLALMRADTEGEVVDILTDAGFWRDDRMWRWYGDKENNWSTIGNQMGRPDYALVEKLVNAIDARLMNECVLAGIDPTSPQAPETIQAAVAAFFGGASAHSATAGRISEWGDTRRREIAKGITLAATGFGPRQGRPCFSIADAGEGQTPRMMSRTFLSIGESNKFRTPFVQGKFNMGGTGILRFCGELNIQLIVTRRNSKLITEPEHPSDRDWGFTIVRREDAKGRDKSSIYTYLAPGDAVKNPYKGEVLSFQAETLPIFPEKGEPYTRLAAHGSLIKLFEYQATGYSNTNILMRDGLMSRIDLLLPEVALPVRLHECRKTYSGHEGSFDTTLTGLTTRLEDNKASNLEPGFPSSCPIGAQDQQMTATIYAFKKDKAETYRKQEGIIFTVNGQTHGYLTLDFFRRKSVGLSYLADSILVIVDCTNLTIRAREKLFMNSRDRLSGGELRQEIEHALEEMLHHHETLRDLKNRRRDEETAKRLDDSKPLEDILENLLRSSPALASFFLPGNRVSNPFKSIKVKGGQEPFEGKRFPTFFKFRNRDYGQTFTRDCHVNMRCRVTFETDVVNDYFSRKLDTGEFRPFKLQGVERVPATDFVGPNLNNGLATLSIQLPDTAKVGDQFTFVAVVTDRTRLEPFENTLIVNVLEQADSTGGNGRRRRPPGDDLGDERDVPSKIAMPKITKVHEVDWPKHTPIFDKLTALQIKHAGDANGETDANGDQPDVYDFFVNVDNAHLKNEMKRMGSTDARLTEDRFVYGMVLIGLALLQQSASDAQKKREVPDDSEEQPEEEKIEDLVERVTRSVGAVLLPMIDSLGQLDEEAVESVTASGEAT